MLSEPENKTQRKTPFENEYCTILLVFGFNVEENDTIQQKMQNQKLFFPEIFEGKVPCFHNPKFCGLHSSDRLDIAKVYFRRFLKEYEPH